MNGTKSFIVKKYDFPLQDGDLVALGESREVALRRDHLISWPVLYILTNARDQSAYIGETTNYRRRMAQHRDNPEKNFDKSLFIDSPLFNQSSTFDYENRLIQLFFADGKYRVTNKNNGYCAFNYYQRALYRQRFRGLWDELRRVGYARNELEVIENSDLYKYSPFKGLTQDQYEAIERIIALVRSDRRSCAFVDGYPGTGKSILAMTLLFKLRVSEEYKDMKVALVAPMEQLRKTYREVAKAVDGLRPGDIIGPSEVVKKGPYDVLLVDEAHRMHGLKGAMGVPAFRKTCERLGLSDSATQWDWMLKSARNVVFFFDPKQQVRATGLGAASRDRILKTLEERGVFTDVMALTTQMRVVGGDEYLDFIYDILYGGPTAPLTARSFFDLFSALPTQHRVGDVGDGDNAPLYELALVDSFAEFCDLQQTKESQCGLSRMLAGYAWDWQSKKDSERFDIQIEGVKKRWNSKSNGNWVNSENAAQEVGSIHTVQGYDLNYGFVIIGSDVFYDERSDSLGVSRAAFKDRGAKKTSTEETLKEVVLNAYYVLMTRGILGTYIYVCDDGVKKYLQRFLPTIRKREEGRFEITRLPSMDI